MVSFEWKINLQQVYELRLFFLCKGKLDLHCVLGMRKFCMSSEVMRGELPRQKNTRGMTMHKMIYLIFFSGQTTASRLSSRHEGEGWMWVAFAFLLVSFLAALRSLCNSSRYFLQHYFGKARRDHRYHNNSTRRMICKLLDLFVTYFSSGKFAVKCG